MPRRDGTGPMGRGSMTGRRRGLCNTAKGLDEIGGLGLGCRRGFRRNGFNNSINSENQKDLLNEQKAILEDRLDLINSKLNTSENDK